MACIGTDRGANSTNTGGQNTLVATPGSNFAANSTAVLLCAYDNSGTGGSDPYGFSIVDSVGNEWFDGLDVLNDPGNANAGIVFRMFYSYQEVAPLTTSDTVTIQFGSTTVARAWNFIQVLDDTGLQSIFAGSTYNNSGTSAATNFAVSTPVSVTGGDLVIGGVGREGNDNLNTEDTDTLNGTWSTAQHGRIGTTTSGAQCASQYKSITGGLAVQAFGQTFASSRDQAFGIVVFRPRYPVFGMNMASGNANGASLTLQVQANSAWGLFYNTSLFVLCVEYDNTGSGGSDSYSSIADTDGNTWTSVANTIINPGGTGTGTCLRVFTCEQDVAAFAPADTVTVTFSTTVTVKCWAMMQFLGTNGRPRYKTSWAETSTSASPTITSGASISAGNCVIGVIGREDVAVISNLDVDEDNGFWLYALNSGVGTGNAGGRIVAQMKHCTATATQTYNIVSGTSADNCEIMVEIEDGAPASTPIKPNAAAFGSVNVGFYSIGATLWALRLVFIQNFITIMSALYLVSMIQFYLEKERVMSGRKRNLTTVKY